MINFFTPGDQARYALRTLGYLLVIASASYVVGASLKLYGPALIHDVIAPPVRDIVLFIWNVVRSVWP